MKYKKKILDGFPASVNSTTLQVIVDAKRNDWKIPMFFFKKVAFQQKII